MSALGSRYFDCLHGCSRIAFYVSSTGPIGYAVSSDRSEQAHCVASASGAPAAYATSGSVLKVEMTILDKQSKGISIDEQSQDDVMHLYGFRETDRFADQPFDPRP